MKKCYTLVTRFSVLALMLVSVFTSRAQYVTIPDANFITWLNTHGYSGCLSGNQLDTTCSTVLNTHGLYTTGTGIYNFTGLQYFKNLDTLDCSRDSLQLIPSFPATLKYLNCGYNFMGSLPALPASLTYLSCEHNGLGSLPALPPGVSQVNCSFNQLNTLPALPTALTLIYCNYNFLSSLPSLPAHLVTIDCSNNSSIGTLPSLPASLQQLICEVDGLSDLPTLTGTALTDLNCVGNMLDSIPVLPVTLQSLYCGTNVLTGLPVLPAGLLNLACDANAIDSLPTLPAHLQTLKCGNNNITVLPAIPVTVTTLWCNQNRLTELPALPDSLYQLNCSFNQYLACLPQLKRIVDLRFYNCSITCLPDYGHVTTSNPALNTLPLCGLFSPTGCGAYNNNISGMVFYDGNHDCIYNAADAPQPQVKVELLNNGNVLQQAYTDDMGTYSFTTTAGTYIVKADTSGLPYRNTCQHNGTWTDVITASDSTSYGNNFAFSARTSGFDVGVTSILNNYITPAPASNIKVNMVAGDISALYGQHGAAGNSGQVHVTFSGPVTYIGPATGALTPSLNGNRLTWTFADFGAIDNYTSFNTQFMVNANAVAGDDICMSVTVTSNSGDFNTANNTLNYCFKVVAAQAANVKEVYPAGQIDSSSQWLTYTIRFANTGADTAQNILITDTLDANLNPASFQLLNTSTKPLTQLFGNVVKFSFANINLPTTAVNDSGARGFVQYRVKTNGNLPGGTIISNAAVIAYNNQTTVSTNIVTDTVMQTPNAVQSLRTDGFDVQIFPNPANSLLYVHVNQPGAYTLKLFDIQGKLLHTETTATPTEIINVSALAPGIYIAEIGLGDITQRVKWVKM